MSSPSTVDWSKVDRPEQLFNRFPSRRSVVYSTKGLVASSQPLATQAGLEILTKGGNAGRIFLPIVLSSLFLHPIADAAVAVSAALNVTEPSCCGIGGSAYLFPPYLFLTLTK